jgi:hypothetical protein
LLERLRKYVNAYEHKEPLPPTGEFVVTAHTTAAGSAVPYWLEIRPEGFGPPGQRRQTQPQFRREESGNNNVAINGAPVITQSPLPTPNPNTTPSPRQREGAGRFRAIFACEYIARLTPDEAKKNGIDVQGRLGMGYAPGIGIFAVVPRQLPQGGGSLRE